MSPKELVVVSPHRDDAAFSAGLTIRRWTALGWPVTIVNCFTISQYAPFSLEHGAEAITELRSKEDAAFAAALGERARFVDLGMLDAPLRLQCSADVVCGLKLNTVRFEEEVEAVFRALQPFAGSARCGGAILLAPLSIGDHIDHVLARQACLNAIQAHPIAFYEDLPYSGAIDTTATAATEIGRALGRPLSSVLMAVESAAAEKDRFVALYPSQLSSEERAQIARYTASLGGERVWADIAAGTILTHIDDSRTAAPSSMGTLPLR